MKSTGWCLKCSIIDFIPGYKFKDEDLIEQILSRPKYADEERNNRKNQERSDTDAEKKRSMQIKEKQKNLKYLNQHRHRNKQPPIEINPSS